MTAFANGSKLKKLRWQGLSPLQSYVPLVLLLNIDDNLLFLEQNYSSVYASKVHYLFKD